MELKGREIKVGDELVPIIGHNGRVVFIRNTPNDHSLIVSFGTKQSSPLFWRGDSNIARSNYPLTEGVVFHPDHYYYWFCLDEILGFVEAERTPVPAPILSCCQCSNSNPYAEANLKDGRHLCFGCRSSYRWKYADVMS